MPEQCSSERFGAGTGFARASVLEVEYIVVSHAVPAS